MTSRYGLPSQVKSHGTSGACAFTVDNGNTINAYGSKSHLTPHHLLPRHQTLHGIAKEGGIKLALFNLRVCQSSRYGLRSKGLDTPLQELAKGCMSNTNHINFSHDYLLSNTIYFRIVLRNLQLFFQTRQTLSMI
jgi:hypothetical protein